MIVALLACQQKTEEAPPTLEEAAASALVAFETKDFDTELQVIVEWSATNAGVEAVELPSLDVASLKAESAAMSFSENVSADEMFGAAVAAEVSGSLADYAATVPEADQVWCDPSGYSQWIRTITEGTEADFLAGNGLRTNNDIIKTSLIYDIPYPTQKDYQWVEVDGKEALLFRAWLYKEGWDGDAIGAIGGFQLELWLDQGESVLWFVGAWNQVVSPLGDEDFLRNELIKSLGKYLEGTEAHVNGG
jgi:hypothetical protein